ncbi:MAG: STAS-like domain-containing protein [Chloroflexi bacterium]|nr:STAS-like domain-containing protein [Chloroflexota bacterium]
MEMARVRIYDLLPERVLVTRESARSIQPALAAAFAAGDGEVILDFTDVAGVTPSFVDEILAVLEECIGSGPQSRLSIVFLNPPTRLSAKFEAVDRAHALRIVEDRGGAWVVTRQYTPAVG